MPAVSRALHTLVLDASTTPSTIQLYMGDRTSPWTSNNGNQFDYPHEINRQSTDLGLYYWYYNGSPKTPYHNAQTKEIRDVRIYHRAPSLSERLELAAFPPP